MSSTQSLHCSFGFALGEASVRAIVCMVGGRQGQSWAIKLTLGCSRQTEPNGEGEGRVNVHRRWGMDRRLDSRE